jgi:HTH-type transcriptional regulator, competence development regulator
LGRLGGVALHTLHGFAHPISFQHPSFICSFLPIFANICQDTNFRMMATQFGERIRELRTNKNLLLRQVASMLDVDASILSKIELGERRAKKEQVLQLADILKTNAGELMTLWLADQVYDIVKDEDTADDALKSVSKKIKKSK